MAERTQIPGTHFPVACGHWETLLADALDGLLLPRRGHLPRAHGRLHRLHSPL